MGDGMFAERTSDGGIRITLPRSVLKQAEEGPRGSLILDISEESAVLLRNVLNQELS